MGDGDIHRLAVVGSAAAAFAHELNDALAAIAGSVELLRKRARPEDAAALRVIAEAARDAATVCRGVSTLSLPEDSTPCVVDLDPAVERSGASLARLVGRRIALSVELRAGDAQVLADPWGIERAVANMVLDASAALPDGGSIAVSTAVEGAHAVVTVAASGPRGRSPLGLATAEAFARRSGGHLETKSSEDRDVASLFLHRLA